MFVLTALMLVQGAAATQTQAPAAQPEEDKVICRNIQEAYSRIPERVCKKKSEWAQMEKDTQDDWRSSRNHRGEGLNPGPGN